MTALADASDIELISAGALLPFIFGIVAGLLVAAVIVHFASPTDAAAAPDAPMQGPRRATNPECSTRSHAMRRHVTWTCDREGCDEQWPLDEPYDQEQVA